MIETCPAKGTKEYHERAVKFYERLNNWLRLIGCVLLLWFDVRLAFGMAFLYLAKVYELAERKERNTLKRIVDADSTSA